MNGKIETTTGDLLEAGFSTFIAGAGETLRSDVPHPPKRRLDPNNTEMHRWNGTSWILVPNWPKPIRTGLTIQSLNGSRWRIKVDNSGRVITEGL